MSEQIPLEAQRHPEENQYNTGEIAHEQIQNNSQEDHNNSNQNSDDVKKLMDNMEKEAQRLRELNASFDLQGRQNEDANKSENEKRDIDARSIYIGNVDYGSTPLELQQHFSSSGVVNRVTIPLNKFSGQPKGFAYLEFADIDAVNKAIATLDGSTFRQRELKVCAKRTNVPGLSTTNRGYPLRGNPRGRAFRGFRGRFPRGMGGFRGPSRFTPY